MRISELKKYLPIEEDVEINPTVEIEDYFFGKGSSKSYNNYRTQAIDFSIENRLPLTTTLNNAYEMATRFVKVACPICGKDMIPRSGGGNQNELTVDYRCEDCKVHCYLTILTPDGITFQFD